MMFANMPKMAAEWQAHTPKGAKLPERVKGKKRGKPHGSDTIGAR